MLGYSNCYLLALAMLLLLVAIDANVETAVFRSPKFVLKPGSVANKYYYNIDFPKGHVAIKDFHAEVVDKAGQPVPLYETYLHHWVVVRYYQRKSNELNTSDIIVGANSGICDGVLNQHFGLGSETRKTTTYVPDPYGIEIGNPKDVPEGYEERWVLNLHAIDTRGVEDTLRCSECKCDLYNVTKDEHGQAIEPDYIGGLRCCYDKTRCRVEHRFKGSKKKCRYLKYTVKYVEWDASIVPVKIYILDVTCRYMEKARKSNSKGTTPVPGIEYSGESCSADGANFSCTDTKKVSIPFPISGDVIYGVAHQHTGGAGSTLHGEDGRVICSSHPIYGQGRAPGIEAGYVLS